MATVPGPTLPVQRNKSDLHCLLSPRSPALIGCFVVDRLYFEEIGLLDEGMEVYGGENVELGIRVSRDGSLQWPLATGHPDNGLKITIILMAVAIMSVEVNLTWCH